MISHRFSSRQLGAPILRKDWVPGHPGGARGNMESAIQARVLVVDDDRFHRELARDALADLARVECCGDAESALEALAREPAALVLSDLTMPGASGLDLLERVRRAQPSTDFVLLTANASVESAVEALRMGAADYLRKPIRPEELRIVVQRTLERRRLVADNERLRETLATMEACRAFDACLEPTEVYAVALDVALRVLGRERGLAVYHRANVPLSNGVEFRGFSESEEHVVHHVLVQEKPVQLEAIRERRTLTSGPVHEALREVGIDAGRVVAMPVRGQETESAVLFLPEGDRPLREDESERLAAVAAHASMALRHAERYQQAKERAFIDDVTEVYNARYLAEAMEREVRRAERYGTELSVLFLDLDRFKLVNDRHGHLVGSQALRQLSRVLADCVRQVDTLARYGGDEFTILLVDTSEPSALVVAERIRRAVAETAFEASSGSVMHLTCSVGVATYPLHGRDREALVDAADKAMYRAKSNGRDRVCSAAELVR